MQQQAAQAYQQTAKISANPSELEAQLLSKAAAKLIHIQKNWVGSEKELYPALTYNRKLWSIFLSSVATEDNPLPKEIKENIANLGLFVLNHTMRVQTSPNPEKLDVLININRDIAAGLRDR
jgi:flagellar protein FlaF